MTPELNRKTTVSAIPRRRSGEVYDGTPFRFPLRNEFPGRAGKLMRLAHDGRVVRYFTGWNDNHYHDLRSFSERMRRDGIAIPRYDVLRAPRWDRPGKEATYIVTEGIIGERLDEIARPSEIDWLLPVSKVFYKRFYNDIDLLVHSLIRHYLDILENGGLVFNAMDQSQFLYGTRKAERQPAMYFVDLDPTYVAVPAMKDRTIHANVNEAKADFEKPINILFEMKMLHPDADFPRSTDAARAYFAHCAGFFHDFYSRTGTPAWARSPNFEYYQRMKTRLMAM
jgi:hypothetical protein